MNAAMTQQDNRSRWRRFVDSLFPYHSLPLPDDDRPGFAPAYIKSFTECRLDLADRLRLLVSGRCEVVTRIYTDVPVAKMDSEAVFNVLPPKRTKAAEQPPRQEKP